MLQFYKELLLQFLKSISVLYYRLQGKEVQRYSYVVETNLETGNTRHVNKREIKEKIKSYRLK